MVRIQDVEVLEPFRVRLQFTNGTAKELDDPAVSGDVKDRGKAILVDFASGKNELHPNVRAALIRERQLTTEN